MDIAAALLILAGSVLAFTSALGIVRFPDTLTRMHAAAKPQALGLVLTCVGAAIRLRHNADLGMLVLIALFALLTSPVLAHLIGRLAYRELQEDQAALQKQQSG
ncbi:monovalent cation/H(+) antiporter subunit G [Segniliparus rugosus]|uniref:Monovalent cation/proton antiporter, MnhG/PhaG subunit n=1 Tax=Segniliparus rugosus (strain ATCC BAA-974 / DSM 45345 / CCUG 50838 / CIP 108380 / JCM 13579 / CDC 945) TaxID=679197 RepID=E5XQN5_SEGRC|nr:monovalent cation/H(+) antiporter subunit G [Segniliparus rugosus]EFV13348.1 monovalent cation/proton antiporter, MnhG/PhaG subunit [Segniliparus rugosus ATCC BAA-974]